ncbi:MAG: peptidoglycan DD-metalloendopeptidase family protein [Lachnospirales bacterium]
MKQDEHSTASAKQRRLYYGVLSILALVTIAALVITMTAGSREEPDALQQAQEESDASRETSQEEVALAPQDSDTEAVQGDLVEPNEEIQTAEEESSVEESSVETAEETSEPAVESTEETQTTEAPVDELEVFDPVTDKMVWPVSGNVLMEYSTEALIYDETLDQYRANDSMSIGAASGEAVVAAAAGTVKSIGQNDRLGNYVVISHGNGLETTYGQLQEAVDVAVDETVSKGETIGYVADPTWYSLALGTHVEFQVTLEGTPVDPTLYLESTLDE